MFQFRINEIMREMGRLIKTAAQASTCIDFYITANENRYVTGIKLSPNDILLDKKNNRITTRYPDLFHADFNKQQWGYEVEKSEGYRGLKLYIDVLDVTFNFDVDIND